MFAIELIAERARLVRATAKNDQENVPSPCISVCQMDAAAGWCEGCLRTLDEIAAWGTLDNTGKRALWSVIERRLDLRRAQEGQGPP